MKSEEEEGVCGLKCDGLFGRRVEGVCDWKREAEEDEEGGGWVE